MPTQTRMGRHWHPSFMRLRRTGREHDGGLSLFWPYHEGALGTLCLSNDGLPAWTALLEDTRDSACFAVASGRCLAYHPAGHAQVGTKISNPCPKARLSSMPEMTALGMRRAPVLEMAFDVSESFTALPPSPDSRVDIDQGSLELQETVSSRRLLLFRPPGLTFRVRTWRTCRLGGHKDCIHGAISDAPKQTRFAVLAYVADAGLAFWEIRNDHRGAA
ncbi:hypothetical protein EJ03DRAFT_198537 [Teratosphaeria nubilosa]|uniref:Uncharacterized protein n=1 Tax=Teratosphaeria nubilosa TaxID=161662 RepID=A0A6G1KZL5_9PEZI|nr:hypothetical protein EJ03DRAFT_198537 [Teratosphaeria nubilosa]